MKNLLVILLFSYTISFANDYTFAIKFNLTCSAVNRALQQQYNQPNFITTTGSYAGYTYTLRIAVYRVEFSADLIKLRMEVKCTTNVGNYDIVLQPTIVIPNSSISTEQVKAALLNLPDKVNELNIPGWLKTVLINTYESLEPWVYPSKLLTEVNNSSLFIRQRNVDVMNLELGYQLLNNELIINVTVTVNASKPNFGVKAIKLINTQTNEISNLFCVLPNINVEVKEVILLNLSATTTIWHGNPNTICEKDEETVIDMGQLSNFGNGPTYIAKVLYKIHETFYYREYASVHYSNYLGATSFINN